MTEDRPVIERVHPPRTLIRLGNPIMRFLAERLPAIQRFVIVLHYKGRKTGRRFHLPVGYHMIEGNISIFTNSEWRHNFRDGMEVEVTYRAQRQPARAILVDDLDLVASVYEALLEELGSAAGRRLGVRVNINRPPTHEEWVEVIRGKACRSCGSSSSAKQPIDRSMQQLVQDRVLRVR